MANFYGKYSGVLGGSGGGGGAPTFVQEAPSGLVNDVNVTYTLSGTPTANANVLLWKDGILMYQGIDYSISGLTITMTVAPSSTPIPQTLWAFYS